jgi:hypothetical protein
MSIVQNVEKFNELYEKVRKHHMCLSFYDSGSKYTVYYPAGMIYHAYRVSYLEMGKIKGLQVLLDKMDLHWSESGIHGSSTEGIEQSTAQQIPKQVARSKYFVEGVNLDTVQKQQYDSSIDFENAFANLQKALIYASRVIKSPAMKDWMDNSVSNYSMNPNLHPELVKLIGNSAEEAARLYNVLSDLA